MNTNLKKKSLFSSLTRRKVGILIASFIVFSASMTVLAFEGTKKTVALTIDGEEVVVKTHAATVGDVLQEQNVPVKETDYISLSLDTKLEDQIEISWEPAKQIAVKDGDEQSYYWTTAKTVQEFLDEENIKIQEHDQFNFSVEDQIKDQLKLEIDRAFALTLADGKKKKDVWSTSTTVADFLKQQGIKLGDLDRVEPNLKEDVEPNSTVKVIRVEKVTDVVEEPIDYTVVTKKDANLLKGTEKVVQTGKEGLLKKEFEVIKENGKEVDRKLIAEKTVQESQDKVVAVGTKVIVAQASRGVSKANTASSQETPSGGKEMYMSATAYTASCNGCSGVTATGINLHANPGSKVIAVDPNVIPLGSKVWVEGYGYAIAGDTGGAIKGNRIDVFVPTKEQAYRFGRKKVKIRVLN
ncbi:G5 and 3D domain-containing protein [Bacillus niameyensis]|uniref:G5 and 3D domain-containing protein n=1 Tax=Bacillus niameyensis TaxID=1522308 RepID=UPI0007802FB9|nr:G5 and 3D domain-containing protein [Bacillus niameyensis]